MYLSICLTKMLELLYSEQLCMVNMWNKKRFSLSIIDLFIYSFMETFAHLCFFNSFIYSESIEFKRFFVMTFYSFIKIFFNLCIYLFNKKLSCLFYQIICRYLMNMQIQENFSLDIIHLKIFFCKFTFINLSIYLFIASKWIFFLINLFVVYLYRYVMNDTKKKNKSIIKSINEKLNQ